MPELTIVIPAYNEQDRIVTTLDQTIAYLGEQPYSSEVLVISDGSTDCTGDVVHGYTPPESVGVRFLEYRPNRGKGYAVRYGMLRAKGDIVMFMDADYSVPIQELDKALSCIEGGFDIAMASRALSGSIINQHQNLAREISARIYTLIQTVYLGITYRDTQCGFKVFTRRAARELFERQKLHSVIFDPEILWLAKRMGFQVAEFPVTWTHIADSRIQYDNLRKSLFVFQELFRIRFLHPGIS
ncbi:Glycosyl transferase, family 2 [Olavius algarvensis associated proteobacterium Delta 3]|nr:Glycosyl transferase, family 2 [Olavius algarvensis associated proteobacterium Delta 3]CAB5131399.1 Glycosyl transferase, family 2 [Olavius algarvensis associated proteobacterium Delta 3]